MHHIRTHVFSIRMTKTTDGFLVEHGHDLLKRWRRHMHTLVWKRVERDADIIATAVEVLERLTKKKAFLGDYGAASNNCHQWVLDVATGRGISTSHSWGGTLPCWIPIKNHIQESKDLAKRRMKELVDLAKRPLFKVNHTYGYK